MVFSMMLNSVMKADECDGHKERKLLVTLQPACVEEDECVEGRVAVIGGRVAFQEGMEKMAKCLGSLQEAAATSARLCDKFDTSGAIMVDDSRAEADISGRQVVGEQGSRVAAGRARFETAVTELEQSIMDVCALGAQVAAEWVNQRSRIRYIDFQPTRVRAVRPRRRDEATEAETPAQETRRAEPDLAGSQEPPPGAAGARPSAVVQGLKREVRSLRDDLGNLTKMYQELRDEIRTREAPGPDQEQGES